MWKYNCLFTRSRAIHYLVLLSYNAYDRQIIMTFTSKNHLDQRPSRTEEETCISNLSPEKQKEKPNQPHQEKEMPSLENLEDLD